YWEVALKVRRRTERWPQRQLGKNDDSPLQPIPRLHPKDAAGRALVQGLNLESGVFGLAWPGKMRPGEGFTGAWVEPRGLSGPLEPVTDLIGPEPLKPDQGFVERLKIVVIDAADLLQGLQLPLIERADHLRDFLPLIGEADPHGTPIGIRALVVDVAGLNQLLEIVGDVRAKIVAAACELAGGKLGVANIVEEQGLDTVHIGTAQAFELILDDVQQQPMQPLDQLQGNQITTL